VCWHPARGSPVHGWARKPSLGTYLLPTKSAVKINPAIIPDLRILVPKNLIYATFLYSVLSRSFPP
jgi:hypothetical protein